MRTSGPDRPAGAAALVAAEIVEHRDVARPQGGREALLRPCREQFTTDGAICPMLQKRCKPPS